MSAQQYLQLLASLQSTITATRQAAESSFDQLRTNQPGNAVSLTVNVVCTPSYDLDQRVFACVLFRRMVRAGACFTKLTMPQQQQVRSSILNMLTADDTTVPKVLRRPVVHCVASLAVTCDAKTNDLNKTWPELLQTVNGLAGNENTQTYHRESGHELLRRLIEAKPDALLVHKQVIQSVMSTGLSDSSEQVRLAALQGCSQFLILLETNEDRSLFLPLVPALMNTLSGLLSGGNELSARDALESLVSVAEAQPTFWRTHLPLVWNAMCTVTGHQGLEPETRTMALELLLAICEQAGGMVRKHLDLIQQLVQIVMSVLCQVDDVNVQEWSTAEENEATYGDSLDEDEISNIAEQAMDRLATSLGGKIMTPILLPIVTQYLNDTSDWRKRRAGLEAIALCAAGCGKSFENMLNELVTTSIQYCKDDHVRVRYSSLHCLGQFANDFQPQMQRKYQNVVLPVLGASLTTLNAGCERLQRLAVSALINMCNEHCDKTTFMHYSKPLLEGLFALLSSSGSKTQADVFAAVAAIASVIEQQFIPYYNIFMPLALNVLNSTDGAKQQTQDGIRSHQLLRGRAMECTGVISCAVGKEQFMNHASQVMDILMTTYESNLSEDNPQKEFILPTLCAVCMCLENDFVPYMARIMPSLIEAATYSEEGILIVANEEEHERGQLNLNGQFQMTQLDIPGQGIAFVGVNTVALQGKKNAVDILLRFVYALGDHYGPFVSDTVQALLPSVQKGVIPQMRSAAAAAMQGLVSTGIKCCVAQHKQTHGSQSTPTPASMQPAQDLLLTVVPALVHQLGEESNEEVRGFVAQSLSECLQMARESGGHVIGGSSSAYNPPLVGVPQENVVALVVKLRTLLTEGVNRQMSAHQAVRDDPDCDEGMVEQLMDEMEDEAGYTTSILDSLGWIIKTYGAVFFPIYKEHLSTLCTSLCASELGHVRAAGICMLDDVLEHCGETTASVVVPDLLAVASQGMGAEEPMVRQASVYGLGLCARYGGTAFTNQIAGQCLPQLIQYVDFWKRDDVRNKALQSNFNVDAPTDCAISAVGSIAAHRPEVASSEIWSKWLSWLPLDSAMGDRLEAMDVHKLLVDQITRNNSQLLGPNNEHLLRILNVLARAARGIPLQHVLDSVNYDEGDDVALMHRSDLIRLSEVYQNIKASSAGGQIIAGLNQEDQQTLNGLST
jgi:hypothetical protein